MKFINYEVPQVLSARQVFEAAEANLARLQLAGEPFLRANQLPPAEVDREFRNACAALRAARRTYLAAQGTS